MADHEFADRLGDVPLFAQLPKRDLNSVLQRTRVVEHPAGQEILTEDGGAVGFHLILDGTAVVSKGGASRGKLGRGDYFGEISLIDGKPRSATVTADGPLKTLSLAAWDFKPLLDEHPELARALLLGLCAHLRAAEADKT